MVILPPVPNEICSTWFGTQLCKNGIVSNSSQPASIDAVFRFSRWTNKDSERIENRFFSKHGANAGALFVDVTFPPTGPEWTLWIQGPNQLFSGYLFTDSEGEDRKTPQFWRRSDAQQTRAK